MRYLNLIRYIRNWHVYFLHKFGLCRKNHFVFHGNNNITITVPLRLLPTFKEVFFADSYTKHIPSKYLTIDKIKTIVDIGANAGYFSLFMLSRFPDSRVFAFEPMPNNFKLLQQNKTLNPGFNFEIFNQAISHSDRPIVLQYDASDSFTTAASIIGTAAGTDKIEVNAQTLLSFMASHPIDAIDFLKLDCEGSEYPILYNMPQTAFDKIRLIALEAHSGPTEKENKEGLIYFLKNMGYDLYTASTTDLVWAWRK